MKTFYLMLMIVSAVVGYGIAGWFVTTHGFNFALLVRQMVETQGALQALSDLLITGLIVYIWILHEGRRLRMSHPWLYIVASFIGGGLCFGLALFLYMRQRRIESQRGLESQRALER